MGHTLRKDEQGRYEVLVGDTVVGKVWKQQGHTYLRGGRVDPRSTATGWRWRANGKSDYGCVSTTRTRAIEEILKSV